MKQTERSQSSLGLILIAGLAGAVTALLTSPRSGRENRENVTKRFNDATQAANKQLDAAKGGVKEKLATAQDMKHRIGSAIKDDTSKSKDKEPQSDLKTTEAQNKDADKPYFNNWNREE